MEGRSNEGRPSSLENQRTGQKPCDVTSFGFVGKFLSWLSLWQLIPLSKVAKSASMSRLELETFLLTISHRSGGNVASKTGERSVP